MSLNSLKGKLTAAVIAIALVLIAIFAGGLYPKAPSSSQTANSSSKTVDASIPHIVSTNPKNLSEGILITPSQVLEISFSHPIENRGEVKYQITPELEYDIQLSQDRKTVLIKPVKPYETGRGFSLTIKQDTKFDEGKRLPHDEVFNFNTIPHRGV